MEKLIMDHKKNYIPILKWKRAEQVALLELGKECKEAIVPHIELVMPTVSIYRNVNKKRIRKSVEEMSIEIVEKFYAKRIVAIPEELSKTWGAKPFYLDFSLLYNTADGNKTIKLKVDAINAIISDCVKRGLHVIPVFNLNDNTLVKEAIFKLQKDYKLNLCMRVTSSDLINDDNKAITTELNNKINNIINSNKLSRNDIDLLIDLKETKKIEDRYCNLIMTSQKIDSFLDWRNYIVASGAFPEDLSECKIDNTNELPRLDWQKWQDCIQRFELKKHPIYADYTIRCPIFRDALQYFSSTTSIKYSRDNDWIVLKGKVREFGLYLGNAKLLVGVSDIYYSKDYSWGDNEIYKKAKHFDKWIKNKSIKGTGTAENWIAYGVNHHMTLVKNQIANLSLFLSVVLLLI